MKDRLLLPAEISFFTLETQQAISATSSAAYKLVEPHINAQLISFLLTLVTSFYYLDLCNLVSTLFLNVCQDFFANRRDRSCCFSGKGQLSRRHENFFRSKVKLRFSFFADVSVSNRNLESAFAIPSKFVS